MRFKNNTKKELILRLTVGGYDPSEERIAPRKTSSEWLHLDEFEGAVLEIRDVGDIKASELAGEIADFLNCFQCNKRTDELVDELATIHPTLQQTFTSLCVKWLQKLAQMKNYDGRNEASVKLAKKFLEAVNEEDLHLPMI